MKLRAKTSAKTFPPVKLVTCFARNSKLNIFFTSVILKYTDIPLQPLILSFRGFEFVSSFANRGS
jgi:hypothetical protein